MSPKLHYPSADRNKDPILAVLQATLPADRPLAALEISSGTGQHIAHFAPHFPLVVWRGSEMTQQLLDSIRAHQQDLGLDNTLDPWLVDVTTPPEQWPQLAGCDLRLPQFDLIINVNMMHIAPFEAAQGLFAAAGQLLTPGGLLITYGPYAHNGVLTPESNRNFDQSLRQRDPRWGIRDICQLEKEAGGRGVVLEKIHEMPANNKTLVWRKSGGSR